MMTSWEDYLDPRGRAGAYRDCQRRCRAAFESQHACIQRIFDARRPRVVACMGAGILNDIPYRSFIEAGVTVHLVDWLPGVIEFGIAHSIVQGVQAGSPRCVYCRLASDDPRNYCCGYQSTGRSRAEVCAAFAAHPDEPESCLAFRKGRLPYVHQQDVTGGYASAFGAGLAGELGGVGSWRQAFKRATSLASRAKGRRTPLAIPDRSVDLVLSSMVISQFEHEPYDYFSRQVAALVGPPSAQEERLLRPAMDRLRSILLENQIEGHCEEIERILAPGGRCFLAFEMFHRQQGDDVWHLVEEMQGALSGLAQRFDFDIDGCPALMADAMFETDGGRSMVCHLLLAPKGR
jgi:hypothetical protein